jgi:hypothetical protein
MARRLLPGHLATLVGLLAALWAASVSAQTYTFTPQSSKDLTVSFQTQREGGSRVLILGEVRNGSSQVCERIIVRAEGLDENGRVVSRGRAYVPGTVRPRSSTAFEIRLSSSGSERRYRVEIETFEFVMRPEGGQ